MAVMKVITKNAPGSPFQEKYHDDAALRSVMDYVCHPKKVALIGGWGVDPGNAIYEMGLLSRLYHKDSGVRLRHWTVDFQTSDIYRLEQRMGCDQVTAVWRLAYELTAYYADRYQVFFAVHTDKPLPHIHVVMNTVSHVDGSKYSGTKTEYYNYECYARQVARKYGFFLHMQTDHSEDKFLHRHS